jgi:hypothetical protein
MTLTAVEFLRRFVQHILPRGFVRIRQFGYLASACRTMRLAFAPDYSDGLRLVRQPRRPHRRGTVRDVARRVLGSILSARQLAIVIVGFDTS